MIIIKNKKEIRHGYREFKYSNGKPWHKYTFNNGILLGYQKLYYKDRCKCTLNNGMYLGYREWYDINGNGKIGYKEINI